jgi:hypothetical protein
LEAQTRTSADGYFGLDYRESILLDLFNVVLQEMVQSLLPFGYSHSPSYNV